MLLNVLILILNKMNDYRLTPDELKKEFRDFKLKVISGDIVFNITDDSISKLKKELKFIKDTFEDDDIITGSIALKLFGLLDRDSDDIDILIKDKDRYTGYDNDVYSDSNINIPNRLGYLDFSYKPYFFSKTKKYEVDFFEDHGCNFTELEIGGGGLDDNLIRIHNPIEILDFKMKLAIDGKSDKHNEDLTKIFVGTPEFI
jgi:hypothetical protein